MKKEQYSVVSNDLGPAGTVARPTGFIVQIIPDT
jgi:hypothetical protein